MISLIKKRGLLDIVGNIFFLTLLIVNVTFANGEFATKSDAFLMFKEEVAKLKTKKKRGADLESSEAFVQIFSMVLAKNKNFGSNPGEVIQLVREAADMNIGCAQFALSTFYQGLKFKNPNTGEEEIYLEQDKDEEFKWLKKAAASECSEAHKSLGVKYHEGKIVPANYKKSAYWTREAALRGHGDSMLLTSINYEMGKGLKKDLVLSLSWATLSLKYIQNDHKLATSAKEIKSELEQKLKMPSIIIAQREAEDLDKKIQFYLKRLSKQKEKSGVQK
jgi:hypothetical protein